MVPRARREKDCPIHREREGFPRRIGGPRDRHVKVPRSQPGGMAGGAALTGSTHPKQVGDHRLVLLGRRAERAGRERGNSLGYIPITAISRMRRCRTPEPLDHPDGW
jgi:hypothetical protein